MPVPRQYSLSVQAYYYFQYSAGTDIWYRHSTIFSTAPVPTNNSQPSDISDEYQYPAVFHPVLCQYNASTDIRPAVLARYQASCKFPPGRYFEFCKSEKPPSNKFYSNLLNMSFKNEF